MKKILVLLLLIPVFSYSQRNAVFQTIKVDTLIPAQLSVFSQDSTEAQISEVERVADKYVGKVSEALKEFAEALQIPAEHVYSVLMKQQYIKAITWIATGGVSIFMIILVLYLGHLGDKYDWDDFVVSFVVISGCIIFAIPIFISISQLDVILTGFCNPEYGVIKEISNLIK